MCYYGSGRSFKAEIWQALVDSGLFGGANNIHIEGERYDSLKIVIGGRSSDVMKEGFNRRTTFAYLVPNVDGTKNFVVKVPSEEVFRRYVELYEIEARCFYLLNELSNNIKRESKNHRSVVLLDLNYVREISLVPLQDLQELQKMHYLAGTGYVTIAEYCERRSLGDMEPKKAIEILKNPKVLYGLLNTLLVLEEHDLVLRNIKLDSLFVRDDGTVVVGNLGLISKRP
ncbi:MAG: hypothetical protein LBI29_01635, partial [Rickettsiales bacterium]|nr:hypothetical protein [Rickettsiales bacterium]